MGTYKLPKINNYWESNKFICTKGIGKIMGKQRFIFISQYLCIYDIENKKMGKNSKFIEIQEKFIEIWQKYRYMSQNITIDESIIPFNGRLEFKQYCPLKRNRRGIKFYAVCESKTGFCLNLICYVGQETVKKERSIQFSEQIVLELLRNFKNQYLYLYFDNFYSSPKLLDKLKEMNILCTGIVNVNRQGVPLKVKKHYDDIKQGQFIAIQSQGKEYFIWMNYNKDKKVIMISNFQYYFNALLRDQVMLFNNDPNQFQPIVGSNGKQVKEKNLFKVIEEYNKNKIGVDLMDQNISYYRNQRQYKKYWKQVLFYFMDININNCYIYWKKNQHQLQGSKIIPRLEFRKQIFEQVSWNQFNMQESKLSDCGRLLSQLKLKHFLFKPKTDKRESRKYCKYCKTGRTQFICVKCKVYLCMNMCFPLYHQQI